MSSTTRLSVASWILALALPVGCGGASPVVEATPPPDPLPVATMEAPEEAPPSGPLPDGVAPTAYHLDLDIDPALDRFSGRVDIEIALEHTTQRIWLHGARMNVSRIYVATGAVDQSETTAVPAHWVESGREGLVSVRTDAPVGPGRATIHVEYDAPFDRELRGLYRVDVGTDHYAFTQFEATSARYAFPSFDEPRFKVPFDITMRVPLGQVAIANTRELEARDEGERHVVHFQSTERLPSYLVAMAAGPLDVVEGTAIPANTVRDHALPFRGIAARGRGRELAYALAHTAPLLAALERYTGIAYPYDKLDIVAVPDFASGAMENAGLITFREQLLLLSEQPPESQIRGFTGVMTHELAHQWFGNLVTMPWWNDIWLNEAFATWITPRIVEEVAPEQHAMLYAAQSAHGAMGTDSLGAARRVRQPIESDHDIRNAFDGITYQKGAAVIATFERFVGDETFRRGIHAYLEEHRFGNAVGDDLLRAISIAANRDVVTPFSTFLEQPGVPLVEARLVCGEGGNAVDLLARRYLPLGSTAASDQHWSIPVCVRHGRGRESAEVCQLVEGPTARIALPAGPCPEWIHPNADAAGYYRWSLPSEQLDALATRGYASMTPRERYSFVNNIRAMVSAGTLDIDRALAIAPRFARDTERLVAIEPMALYRTAIDEIATESQRAPLRAQAASLYTPAYRRLRLTPGRRESGETALLRSEIVGFLAHVARDPAVRRDAAAKGRAYLGVGGTRGIHADVVPPDLAAACVISAINEPGGEAAFDAAFELLFSTEDAIVRQRLLGSIGWSEDHALATRALSLTLDPRLRLNEVMLPIWSQSSSPEGRERAFVFVEENFRAILDRLPEGRRGALPGAFNGFCSSTGHQSVETLFQPVIADLVGGPRELRATLEVIDICAARAERQRDALARALAH